MTKSKELELVGTGVPAFMQEENAAAGSIQDDQDLLSPPLLKILQGTSTETEEELGSPGDLYSQAHNAVICPKGETIQVVPIRASKEWMKFEPGEGLIWRTANASDERVSTDPDAWRYKVLHVIMVAPVNHKSIPALPAVFTFRATSYKIGRSLYQQFAKTVEAPSYGQVYSLRAIKGKNSKGTWDRPDFRFAGLVQDQAQFTKFKDIYARMSEISLQPDFDDAEDGGGRKAGGDDADLPF